MEFVWKVLSDVLELVRGLPTAARWLQFALPSLTSAHTDVNTSHGTVSLQTLHSSGLCGLCSRSAKCK